MANFYTDFAGSTLLASEKVDAKLARGRQEALRRKIFGDDANDPQIKATRDFLKRDPGILAHPAKVTPTTAYSNRLNPAPTKFGQKVQRGQVTAPVRPTPVEPQGGEIAIIDKVLNRYTSPDTKEGQLAGMMRQFDADPNMQAGYGSRDEYKYRAQAELADPYHDAQGGRPTSARMAGISQAQGGNSFDPTARDILPMALKSLAGIVHEGAAEGTRAASNALGRGAYGENWDDITRDSELGRQQEAAAGMIPYIPALLGGGGLPLIGKAIGGMTALTGAGDLTGLGESAIQDPQGTLNALVADINPFEPGIAQGEIFRRIANDLLMAPMLRRGVGTAQAIRDGRSWQSIPEPRSPHRTEVDPATIIQQASDSPMLPAVEAPAYNPVKRGVRSLEAPEAPATVEAPVTQPSQIFAGLGAKQGGTSGTGTQPVPVVGSQGDGSPTVGSRTLGTEAAPIAQLESAPAQSSEPAPVPVVPVIQDAPAATPARTGQSTPSNTDATPGAVTNDNGNIASVPQAETTPVATQNATPHRTVSTPDRSMKVEVASEVVPKASIIASHSGLTGQANPDFTLEGGQNRKRGESAYMDRLKEMAEKFDANALLEMDPTTDGGPPIVAGDNFTESGNGRVMLLEILKDRYPTKYAEYQRLLKEKYPEAEGMEDPVLISRRKSDLAPEQRTEFVRLSNKGKSVELTSKDQAATDAAGITDDSLEGFRGSKDLDTALGLRANNGFVSRWIGNLSPSERSTLLHEGNLSIEGRERLGRAILAKVLGDTDGALSRAWEKPGSGTTKYANGAAQAAPGLIDLYIKAREGDAFANDMLNIIGDAFKEIENRIQSGMEPAFYYENGTMFDEATPQAKRLAYAMEKGNDGEGGNSVAKMIHRAATAAAPKQTDMFGGDFADSTAAEVIDGIFAKFNVGESAETPAAETQKRTIKRAKPTVDPDSVTLPADIAGAKPRFGYRTGNYELDFASDYDKVAYILARDKQTGASKAGAKYIAWAKENGIKVSTLEKHGIKVNEAIKDQAKGLFDAGESGVTIRVEPVGRSTPKEQAKADVGQSLKELSDGANAGIPLDKMAKSVVALTKLGGITVADAVAHIMRSKKKTVIKGKNQKYQDDLLEAVQKELEDNGTVPRPEIFDMTTMDGFVYDPDSEVPAGLQEARYAANLMANGELGDTLMNKGAWSTASHTQSMLGDSKMEQYLHGGNLEAHANIAILKDYYGARAAKALSKLTPAQKANIHDILNDGKPPIDKVSENAAAEMKAIMDEIRTFADTMNRLYGDDPVGFIENFWPKHVKRKGFWQKQGEVFSNDLSDPHLGRMTSEARKAGSERRRSGDTKDYERDPLTVLNAYINDMVTHTAMTPAFYRWKEFADALEARVKSQPRGHEEKNVQRMANFAKSVMDRLQGTPHDIDNGLAQLGPTMPIIRGLTNLASLTSIALNVGPAVTQLVSMAGLASTVHPRRLIEGVLRTTMQAPENIFQHNQFGPRAKYPLHRSKFIAARWRGDGAENKTVTRSIVKAGFAPASTMQKAVDTIVWNSAYEQAKAQKLSGDELIYEADRIAEEVLGTRKPGNRAQYYDSQFLKLFNQFTEEPNAYFNLLATKLGAGKNARNTRNAQGKSKIPAMIRRPGNFALALVGTYLINEQMKKLLGYGPAADPIEAAMSAKTETGQEGTVWNKAQAAIADTIGNYPAGSAVLGLAGLTDEQRRRIPGDTNLKFSGGSRGLGALGLLFQAMLAAQESVVHVGALGKVSVDPAGAKMKNDEDKQMMEQRFIRTYVPAGAQIVKIMRAMNKLGDNPATPKDFLFGPDAQEQAKLRRIGKSIKLRRIRKSIRGGAGRAVIQSLLN